MPKAQNPKPEAKIIFWVFILAYLENTSSTLAGEDGGEGDISSIVHPHPHSPPSRGRESYIFTVRRLRICHVKFV